MLLLGLIIPDIMRFYLTCFIAFFVISTQLINAQKDLSIRKTEFRVNKPGFRDAWKHVSEGNAFYTAGGVWYADAFNEYMQALVYNSSNAELNYKTGVAALYSDRKEEASGFFEKAIELKNTVSEDVLMLSGRSLQYAGKYADAITKFTAYLNSEGKHSKKNILFTRQCLQECSSAMLLVKDTLGITIENAGAEINSEADDYSEVLTSDMKTMYFASRRQISTSGKRHPDTKFNESIFISRLVNNKWTTAVPAGKALATKYCESPLYINAANNMLYVYSGSSKSGDIKVSVNKKDVWRKPSRIPFHINTKGSETSFTMSRSGDEIYYVSDHGKANIGGKDIYYIKKLGGNKWAKPLNAGKTINTIYDEESVCLSATGDTLWFSSKGHNSIGGFDIFYSVKNSSGEWDNPVNIGLPVNTPWDEVFFTRPIADDSLFYFASNRSGGYGGSDIYLGRIRPARKVVPAPPKPDTVVIRDTVKVVVRAPEPIVEKKEQPVYLTGKVKDSENGSPILARIDIRHIQTDEILETTASSDVDGSYRIKLPAKGSYKIDLRATGYLSDLKRIDVPENWTSDVYTLNIDLIKIKLGKKVVLKNILFQTGKSILTTESYTELDRMVNIMGENAQMKIEISGHTDNTGSEALNLKLSEARAKTVVDYLVHKGINSSRMQFKGYGSSQPISENTTAAGRSKNRRVEFKILEF